MISINQKRPLSTGKRSPPLTFLSHIPLTGNNHIITNCISPCREVLFSPRSKKKRSTGTIFFPLVASRKLEGTTVRGVRPGTAKIVSTPSDATPPKNQNTVKQSASKSKKTTLVEGTEGKDIANDPVKQKSFLSSLSHNLKLHRLASKEDRLWIHKSSSILFCVSSVLIMANLPVRQIFYHDAKLPPAAILNALLWVWMPATTVQALSGARLSLRFRKNDTDSRNMFLNNSIMTLINVCVILKLCIPLPALLDSDLLSQVIIGGLTALVTGMSFRSIAAAPNLLKTRQKRAIKNRKNSNVNDTGDSGDDKRLLTTFKDYFNYIFPIFYPLPFMVGTFMFFVLHDSEWIRNQCELHPNMENIGLYLNVASAFTIGMTSLLVTIRDRKMISKKSESIGISAISIGLTAWLIQTLESFIGLEVLESLLPSFFE